MKVIGDNPIKDPEDDGLARTRAARSFAEHILSLDSSEGLVVGVLGPWGSGKTSFVNLARTRLAEMDVAVLDFNPWMFSGAEQLVESFFVELASQLRIRPGLADIGKDLEEYGEIFSGMAWLPLVGPWIERGRGASKLLSKMLQRRKEGVGGRRAKLENALAALDVPIVVVIDDIDRLTTPEIRDTFKLVRLTASFPNIVYVVAFDRKRVESALGEEGIPGRDYLEKIIQVGVDLPAIPDGVLNQQVLRALGDALEGLEPEFPFSQDAWPDAFMEVVRPLLHNMRDVRRYAAAVRGTATDLDGQVEMVDVLSLEAIRVFLPDVFQYLAGSVEALTTTSSFGSGSQDSAPLKARVEELLSAAGPDAGVVTAAIKRLFPAAERHVGGAGYGGDWKGRWLRARRVAHEDILLLYLERVVGEDLRSFIDAEQAWTRMANRDELDSYLRSLDLERLQDVIAALETYQDQFVVEHVVPGVVVLLNLLPSLPARPRAMFDIDTRIVVGRVVYRLLQTLPDENATEVAVNEILPQLATLYGQLELIDVVGHREGRGHGLVSEDAASELERAWRTRVRSASVNDLVAESDLFRIALLTLRGIEAGEDALTLDADPRLTAALLASAVTESRSGSMGSRAIKREQRLSWDVLVQIFGGEDEAKTRVEDLRGSELQLEGLDDILALAEKYIGGWRPDEF